MLIQSIQNETKNIKTNKKEYNIMGPTLTAIAITTIIIISILYWVPNSMKELWVEKYQSLRQSLTMCLEMINVSKLNNG